MDDVRGCVRINLMLRRYQRLCLDHYDVWKAPEAVVGPLCCMKGDRGCDH